MKRYYFLLLTLHFSLLTLNCFAQLNTPKNTFTKADTLRGSNNENRDWWDVLHYYITVKPDFEKKEIEGVVRIKYKSLLQIPDSIFRNLKKQPFTIKYGEKVQEIVTNELNSFGKLMQIDLKENLLIDSVFLIDTSMKPFPIAERNSSKKVHRTNIDFEKKESVYLLKLGVHGAMYKWDGYTLEIFYHGKPREAKKAPWDGGWVWSKDKLGRPFVSVACQGLGASSWFPCKDLQSDEPDNGASLTIVVPDSLQAIGMGKYVYMPEPVTLNKQGLTTKHWYVRNPINTYCIVPYIGNYTNFTDTFVGEKGTLDLSYWVLDYNKEKAEEQFKQVKPMLKAFEYWFGAYPFYEDGYKLVEAPYLGMEHQSAIAYGNGFQNGYRGRDLSGSGWGLKWDFIIVHESGHEWFANSITTKDIADMWVHEGFTNYSEVLFTEYYYGKEAGYDYCYGLRKNILNDEPIIGPYGVNKEGSGDMYYKAANMLHSIRNALNDDKKFRKILRGMNVKFYHQTVTTKDIEDYLINETGLDLQKTFDQYLHTTQIPILEYYFEGKKLFYKYSNCIDGFNMPITIPISNKKIIPTNQWQHKRLRKKNKDWFTEKNIERLYLLKVKQNKL